MKKQFIKCPECGEVQIFDMKNFWQTCNGCDEIFIDQQIKPLPALSIKQPWAWLIVNGHKDIENRNTLKNFRGTFLIHSGMSHEHRIPRHVWELLKQKNKLFPDDFDKGGIIGYAEIYDCVTESDSPWFVGKYGLLLRNAKPLPFTPCKGKLNFFYPEID